MINEQGPLELAPRVRPTSHGSAHHIRVLNFRHVRGPSFCGGLDEASCAHTPKHRHASQMHAF